MPPRCNVTGRVTLSPTRTSNSSGSDPSSEIASDAKPPGSGSAPASSTLSVRLTGSPTIAKAGAVSTVTLRSQSPALPVSRTCTGAGKSANAAGSCACPSVTRIAPAIRSAGSSATASDSAVRSAVPSSPASRTRIVRTSSPPVSPSRSNRACSASSASASCASRPSIRLLALSSSTTIAMLETGARSSWRSDGPASAVSSTSAASARSHHPVSPRQSATVKAATAIAASTAIRTSGS